MNTNNNSETSNTPSTQLWKGHQISHHTHELFTIGFSNINGLANASKQSLQTNLRDIAATLHHHNIALLGISEHHLAMNNPKTKQQIYELERQIHKTMHTKFYLQSSQETTPDNKRLMGGTGIIAVQQTIGRLDTKNSGGDSLGRWTYVNFRNNNGRTLTVVSVYQVCQNPTNKLGGTAWHQQRRALDDQQRTSVHPRAAFMTDLTTFLNQLKDNNHDIIVGGDWNETLTDPRSKVLKLSTTIGLVDPWIHLYPDHEDFATHERGSQRIDYVLVSQSLLPSIRSISYSPVGMIQNNDHRTVLLQMDVTKLFGKHKLTMPKFQDRHVRSNDKQSVTKYVEAMYDHLYMNTAFIRSAELEEGKRESASLAEKLDKLIGQASDHAEKQCTRRRPEWFSVKLTNQRLKVSYLKHYLKGLTKSIDRRNAVISKLCMIGATTDIPHTETELRDLVIKENQTLSDMKKDSRQLRMTELSTSDSTPSNKINKHEVALATWKTLSFLKQTTTPTTIDRLEIPSDWPLPFTPIDGNVKLSNPKLTSKWTTITEPDEIEYYLLIRNRLHFGQANGTPFTKVPLSDDVPWEGNSQAVDDILCGKYVPATEVSYLCREVLLACQQRDQSPIIDAKLSYEAFRGKMKKWRESTATSPSGRHLGRYKALFNKGMYNEGDNEYETFTTKQQEIAKLILRIINFCIKTGHVLSRWLTVVNTMICKEPGVFKIHRLRILHLYEADFNLIMGVKWRELIMKADQKRWVNNKQHGARPGCEATSLVLFEEIRTDIAYSTRRTLATVDNDMDSCFDRMLPPLISLNNRAFGLPAELTELHGKSLKSMNYHLRTNNGISTSSYKHTDEFPIYGTGQGSGNSPVLWLLMSATLFDVYDYHAHGASVEDPSGSIKLKMTINGFVDDTNSCINKWYSNKDCSRNELTEYITHDAQLWTDLVNISGGKLELSKCSLHTLSFDFDTDGSPLINHHTTTQVRLLDPITQETFHLRTLNPTQPHKTLGHWKAPAGNSTTQLKQIRDKIKVLNLRIATSSLSRYGARLGYHAIVVSTLRYVLPQCHFQKNTLRKAEKTGMANLIAKCGFSSRTAHAILFAPKEYGGGGFLHWDIIQGEGQILLFIKHWRTTSDLAIAIQIDLAWCQWQAGTSVSILQDTHTPLPQLEARWIPSLRMSLQQFQAKIHLDTSFVVPLEREDDQHIMDIILNQPQYTSTDIRILNYCRMYLHVTTVSEMMDACGTNLLPHILKCERPPWFNPSLNLVIQQRPSHQQIKKRWIPFCKLIAENYHTVGPWLGRKGQRLRRQCYTTNNNPTAIYYWYGKSYWKCSTPTNLGNHYFMQLQEPSTWTQEHQHNIEPLSTKARIHRTVYLRHRHGRASVTHHHSLSQQDKTERNTPLTEQRPHSISDDTTHHMEDPSFVDYIHRQVSPTYRRFLRNIQWTTDAMTCSSFISTLSEDQTLLIVTDGSSIEGLRMTYGGVIGTESGEVLARFNGPATGQTSSFRAEATGVLAGAMILTHLALYSQTDVQRLSVKAYCDNTSVIKRMTDRFGYEKVYPNSTLCPDWDITEEAHHCYKDLKLKNLKFEWVRGHQDDRVRLDELSIQSQYNILADELAEDYAIQETGPITNSYMLQETRCQLSVKGIILHSNYRHQLRRAGAEEELYAYLTNKHGWDRSVWNDIDWAAFHMAARTYSSTEVHLLKLVHDQLPFRTHTARFQPWTSSYCHHCDHPDTMDHLQCSDCNPISGPFREQLQTRLAIFMDSRKCSRLFKTLFTAAIDFWFYADLSEALATSTIHARQTNIGWRLLTRGFFTKSWRQLLEDTTMTGDSTEPTRRQLNSAESTPILAGIIKTIWTSLSELWLSHLAHIHTTSEQTLSPITTAELHSKVRWMHTFHPQLHQTHPHYFRDDLEKFLATATPAAIQAYISQYAQAIQNALDLQLNESERDASVSTTPRQTTTQTTPDQAPGAIFPDPREPSHRKRNRRRKVMTGITHTIRQWFRPTHS